jgi:WD40 repeat protein
MSKIWFTPSNKFQIKLDESIFTLCIPPAGGTIFSGGELPIIIYLTFAEGSVGSSGSVRIWDPVSGKLKDSIYLGSPVLHIIWMEISPHKTAFLTGCEDGSICVYSCRAATFLRDFLLLKVDMYLHIPH